MKNLKFDSGEILNRAQLTIIYGGYEHPSSCFADCKSDSDCRGDCSKCYITQGNDGGCGT